MIYGLDIGGTKIEIAIFSDTLELIDSWRSQTPTDHYENFINCMKNLIESADEKYGSKGSVGIALPGLVDSEGRSLSANIPAANGQRVAVDLAQKIDRHVVCENDCHCFAISEANGGAGDGCYSVYGAIIGTGAAGGFTIDGLLQKGRQGIAGEYGHLQIPAFLQQKYNLPLHPCGCGLPSCYEGYISGPGLTKLYQHFSGKDDTTVNIVSAWRNGDVTATTAMECYLDILGSSFSTLVLSYDPDIIVVGGGMSLIDEVIDQLPDHITNHIFKGYTAPRVVRAMHGDASGARGAAILAGQQRC